MSCLSIILDKDNCSGLMNVGAQRENLTLQLNLLQTIQAKDCLR